MVTPPTDNLNDGVLAAARIAGVDRVIAVGGAQAVAALTTRIAGILGLKPCEVAVCSTGVIGLPMPMMRILSLIHI